MFNKFLIWLGFRHEKKQITQPGQILITITEEARQSAGDFGDIHNCLIATTLRQAGYRDAHAGISFAFIGLRRYELDDYYGYWKLRCHFRGYGKRVVGLQIILTPICF